MSTASIHDERDADRAVEPRAEGAPGPLSAEDAERIAWLSSVPFAGVHLAALAGILWLGWSWWGLSLAVALYYVRMFGLTAGYHRYFSHRSYRTSRPFQFLLALLGATASQKGPLWWAGHHRTHHKYSDTPLDVHSVKQRGFWWSHVKWILVRRYEETDWRRIQDFAAVPELRWLNRWWFLPPAALAGLLFAAWGAWGLVWGFFVSTTLLWHGTFCVNSLAHLIGRRRYQTGDDSRNSLSIALITLGEGWHNNHHFYQRSERQGFFWWEIDVTHYVLCALAWARLVFDLHAPPDKLRRRAGAAPDALPG